MQFCTPFAVYELEEQELFKLDGRSQKPGSHSLTSLVKCSVQQKFLTSVKLFIQRASVFMKSTSQVYESTISRSLALFYCQLETF